MGELIMKLYYSTTNGEVYYAIYSRDLFSFSHTTNIPLSEFTIDEVAPDNKDLCRDLKRTEWKFNEQGQRKYYISAGQLFSRDGWIEQIII